MGTKHEELNLGDIMSDAYIYAVENSEYYDGDPVDVAVVPSGTVRDTYTKGDITVEDVFNSFSLGIGKDGVAGYPLISAYLTGKELKLAAEVDASVSDFMTTARLYCSGLNFAYNPHRMILNKVTDCYLTRADGERIEIQDDKLYHVVTDLYTGQMLGSVMKMSYGLLSLEPKDRDGNPIENLEDQAIMEDDRELKAWDAIARYMQSFEDTDGDGIANVPEYYETTHGRKVVEDSRNIIDLVKQPNKFSAMIAGICLIFIVIIVLVVFLIRRMIRRIKVRKGKRNSNKYTAEIVKVRKSTKSHVSSSLKNLESRGLIERIQSADNKKHIEIVLLNKADRIIEDGIKAQKEFAKIALDGLTVEEKRICKEVFHKICENADKYIWRQYLTQDI